MKVFAQFFYRKRGFFDANPTYYYKKFLTWEKKHGIMYLPRAEGLFSCANDAVMTVCHDFTQAREVHYLTERFPVKIFKEVPIEWELRSLLLAANANSVITTQRRTRRTTPTDSNSINTAVSAASTPCTEKPSNHLRSIWYGWKRKEHRGKEKRRSRSPRKQKSDKPSTWNRTKAWFKSVKSECKKINWASWKSVRSNSIVVIVCVVIFSAALAILDYCFSGAIVGLSRLFWEVKLRMSFPANLS